MQKVDHIPRTGTGHGKWVSIFKELTESPGQTFLVEEQLRHTGITSARRAVKEFNETHSGNIVAVQRNTNYGDKESWSDLYLTYNA